MRGELLVPLLPTMCGTDFPLENGPMENLSNSFLFWRVNGGSTDFPATKIQLTDEGLFAH